MGNNRAQMSAPRLPLVLSARAQRDLDDLLLYTRKQWGAAKRSEYRRALHQGLSELQMFPEMGRPRDEIVKGMRSLSLERHIVYYLIRDTDLFVNRIVHASREIGPTDLVFPGSDSSGL